MATITSGIGLVSGMDFGSMVDQLIAIEARPRDMLLSRIGKIDAQRTAFVDISARVSSLKSRIKNLQLSSFFQAVKANSSNANILAASVTNNVQPGSYSFTVQSLATTHQLISRGFASRNAAIEPGTLTLESAAAAVNAKTTLAELNGFTGVDQGAFRIVDNAGNEATISTTGATTLDDIVTRINDADVNVRAQIEGDHLKLTENEGGTLRIYEVNGGSTAADLGFGSGHSYASDGELNGADVLYLANSTPLDALNDGNGVRRAEAGIDFRITTSSGADLNIRLSDYLRDDTRLERLNHASGVRLGTVRITNKLGNEFEVDLAGLKTVGEIQAKLEDETDGISVVMNGSRLVITDTTEGDQSPLSVEDVEGHAARDLGILGESLSGTKITGRDVLSVDTIGDVIAAINYAQDNLDGDDNRLVTAAIADDGKRIALQDHTGGTFGYTILSVPEESSSKALFDLGFAQAEYEAESQGRRLVGGVNSVLLSSLNGGDGFQAGQVTIAANGFNADVDLRDAETLGEVIARINNAAEDAGMGIEAAYDPTGTRLTLTNLENPAANIVVADITGEFAATLGLDQPAPRIRSQNLQKQYINELTNLADLSGGQGVSLGRFQITNANDIHATVDLNQLHAETVGDVIEAINNTNIGVSARINDTGDGIVLEDTTGGDGTMTVEEEGGSTARDLNILGSAEDGMLDGSFEYKFEVSGGETLDELVTRINDSTLASASILNDGSEQAPYHLNIRANATGLNGALLIDGGGTDLDFTTLSRAQDARVVVGDDPNGSLVITSSSNTISNVVDGLTLNLNGTSDSPVTINVNRDYESMINTLKGVVNDFNGVLDRIDEYSSFDQETEESGILLGDFTVQTLESRLYRAFTGRKESASAVFDRLSEVGIKLSEGARLSFDEQTFREALESNPEEVARFFTDSEEGVAHQIGEALDRLVGIDGLLNRRDETLETQKESLTSRVEQLNELLASKRERMLQQFYAMEQALSQMQSQQSALLDMQSGVSSMAGMMG